MQLLEIKFDYTTGKFVMPDAHTQCCYPQARVAVQNLLEDLNNIPNRPVKSQVSAGFIWFVIYCLTLPIILFYWQFLFVSVAMMMLVISLMIADSSKWHNFHSSIKNVCEKNQTVLNGFYRIINGFEEMDGKKSEEKMTIFLKAFLIDYAIELSSKYYSQKEENDNIKVGETNKNPEAPIFYYFDPADENELQPDITTKDANEFHIVTEDKVEKLKATEVEVNKSNDESLETTSKPSNFGPEETALGTIKDKEPVIRP